MLDTAIGLISTFAATFVGAGLAFLFNELQRQRAERQRQQIAINWAIVALVGICNKLKYYKTEIIDPFNKRHDAWWNAPINLGAEFTVVACDEKELAFLTKTKHANAILEILLVIDNFESLGKSAAWRDSYLTKLALRSPVFTRRVSFSPKMNSYP